MFAEPPTSPAARPASAAAAPLTHATLADFLAHADLPESDSADSSYRRAPPPARHGCLPGTATVTRLAGLGLLSERSRWAGSPCLRFRGAYSARAIAADD